MSTVERDLTYLVPEDVSALSPGNTLLSFTLDSGPKTHFPGFRWTLQFPLPQAYRILLTGPNRPRPPHDNVNAPSSSFLPFTVLSSDPHKRQAVLAFPSGSVSGETLELRIWWAYQLFTEVWQTSLSAVCSSVISKLAPTL